MHRLRMILTLTRAARLPTVWSNCLAGWWLGGGGSDTRSLGLVLAGSTCLYLGGVFLNDAVDANYDRQHRRRRPIPSGAIRHETVWKWGLGWLAAGALALFWTGKVTGGLGLGLIVAIILYNAVHKAVSLAPVLMGVCRFFLYVIGASIAAHGISGWSIWCGLALGVYVTGLGVFMRWERTAGTPRHWAVWLLAAPIPLALVMNANGFRDGALLLSAVFGLSVARALRPAFWSAERNLSRTVSDLVTTIVFVDWLAAANAPRELSFIFLGLVAVTLLAQRASEGLGIGGE
jgi:4-hydroxybenzoate polyprenyltransferase